MKYRANSNEVKINYTSEIDKNKSKLNAMTNLNKKLIEQLSLLENK